MQLPRFTLLESGSLLVSPAHLADAGTYTCLATNSRGVDEASADLVVWGKVPASTPLSPGSAAWCRTDPAERHGQPPTMPGVGRSCLGTPGVGSGTWLMALDGYKLGCPLLIPPRSPVGSARASSCPPAARTRITDPPQNQSVIKGTKAIMNCGVTHDPSVDVRCM